MNLLITAPVIETKQYAVYVVSELDSARIRRIFRRQVLGGLRRQTDAAGHQDGGRERERSAVTPIQPEDHRTHVTRRTDRVRHRPFRYLVRGVHGRFRSRAYTVRSQRATVVENARCTATGQ